MTERRPCNKMDIVLLTNEKTLRELTGVSDNVASKYITAAIREAQDIRLQSVLGTHLLEKLQTLIRTNEINTDTTLAHYRLLADKCQYFLVYAAVTELVRQVSYKVTNAGLVKTGDERVENASFSEVCAQAEYYEAKADFYCYELQKWLCVNAAHFPELTCGCIAAIRSNLRSAASCGLWLGGARSRYPERRRCDDEYNAAEGGGDCCCQ